MRGRTADPGPSTVPSASTTRTRAPGAVRRLRRLWDRAVEPGADAGNAVVEFLGIALLLLVPVVYLVLTLGRIQAATFAVDGAAREAGRAAVTAPDERSAAERAAAATALALGDQGFGADVAADALTMTCAGTRCLEPGATLGVTVSVLVPLPGVPAWLSGAVPLSVPVTATATATVDPFAARTDAP